MKTLLLLLTLTVSLQIRSQEVTSALVPFPNRFTLADGGPCKLKKGKSRIGFNDQRLYFEAGYLQQILQETMKLEPELTTKPEADIRLSLTPTMKGNEHYRLTVNHKGIDIEGTTPQAVFYGIQTLHQVLLGDVCSTCRLQVRSFTIDDEPRFPYRALMLDPARHFLPVNDVKFFIDQMVRYKYNVLQLHLTDDQGWRMEVKAYPQLASKLHYTQKELKELVAYAARRHVEIIPELDIPGHTVGILATFPELACTVADTLPKIVGQTTDLMLCAGMENTYEVYRNIFHEVAAVFPSRRIHLGGDESVIECNWGRCTRCRHLMQQKGYTEARELMKPFFDRMLGYLRKEDKEPILWCELDRNYPPASSYLFDYPDDVTLVTWRNGLTPKCMELSAAHGHRLIMAPGEYTYFDYPQLQGDLPEFNNWGMPVTTLEQAYRFDPGYGQPSDSLTHILGVMGTLWGEAMPDINRVTYMAFPRALALAEAGWTHMEHRNWTSFKERMFPNLYLLMKQGVSVRVPFEVTGRKSATK